MRRLCLLAVTLVSTTLWAQERPSLLARFDVHFAAGSEENLLAIDREFTQAVKDQPNQFEWVWRAAFVKYFLADGSTDNQQKKEWAREGWNLALKAVELQPERVEGYYTVAINIGMYSQAVGILRALGEGLEGKFLKHVDKAIALDSTFLTAGPCVTKGRYFFELPWPLRSYEKSRKMLESCLVTNSESLRARQYLAEVCLAEGKPQEAKKWAESALSGASSYNRPEGERVKERVRALLPEIEKKMK